MALPAFVTKLVSDFRSERTTAHRSTRSEYVELHRRLGSGEEIDAHEVKRIFRAADKSDEDFEDDAKKQQDRLAWHAQRVANQQATKDRIAAESDLKAAQAKLQEAYDKLMPAVDLAQYKLNDASHRFLTTTQAEAWLCDPANILDRELLEREAEIVIKLREVSDELKPLIQDREHKNSSLMNAELYLRQLMGRNPDTWPGFGMLNPKYWSNKDIEPAQERVDDLKSQLSQLDAAIRPRQAEQSRLQRELDSIHAEKLKP